MTERKMLIYDDEESYYWYNSEDECIEIPHGEVLKTFLYMDVDVLRCSYDSMLTRFRIEDYDPVGVDDLRISDGAKIIVDQMMKKLNLKEKDSAYSVDKLMNDYKSAMAQDLILESFNLARNMYMFDFSEDFRKIIPEKCESFLTALIAIDMYNTGKRCFDLSDYDNFLPKIYRIEDYEERITNLLTRDKDDSYEPDEELKQYCFEGTIEVSTMLEKGFDVCYISSVDQLICRDIRNILFNKYHSVKYVKCEVCGKLFPISGKGSHKIKRCGYPYKDLCKDQVIHKSEMAKYKKTLYERIRKQRLRHPLVFEPPGVDWIGRAKRKICELQEKGMSDEEIKEYMNGDTWWKTVRKYGTDKAKGINWDEF